MAIDILFDNAIKAMPESIRSSRFNAKDTKTSEVSETKGQTLSKDDVVLTENAKNLAKATEIAMQDEGIDYEKVATIKQQLADGTYEFNYDRIAEKMIARETELGFF